MTPKVCGKFKGGPESHTWLAGGWKAVLWALTGDLDYFCAMLGTPNYALASGPCMHCKCTMTGPMTWSDFRSEATRRNTRWDPEDWRSWEQRTKCVLLTLPGASCWTIAYDWVHVKYLGVDQYIFGSILFVLVCMVMPGEDEANLATCWAFLKNFFKTNRTPTPFRYMTKLSMFIRSGKFPKLRGKASEIRHFGKALLALWNRFCNPALLLHKRIALMLKHNVHLEDMITNHKEDFAFPPGPAQEFEETANGMLLLLSQVADHLLKKAWRFLISHPKAICFKNWPFWADAWIPKSLGALWARTRCNECSKSLKPVFVETKLINKLWNLPVTTGWLFTCTSSS